MKACKIAVTVILLLATAVFINSYFIGRLTAEMAEEINAVNTENAEEMTKKFEELFERFQKYEKYISLTVSHDDLTNIEEAFSELIGAARAEMTVDVITQKSRLADSLEHLGRLSGINIESII